MKKKKEWSKMLTIMMVFWVFALLWLIFGERLLQFIPLAEETKQYVSKWADRAAWVLIALPVVAVTMFFAPVWLSVLVTVAVVIAVGYMMFKWFSSDDQTDKININDKY